MGVSAMEILSVNSGKAFFTMSLQEGQQEVTMKALCLRLLVQIVVGLLDDAQVGAHGHFHHTRKAQMLKGGLHFLRGAVGSNWPTKDGASGARTANRRAALMAVIVWKIPAFVGNGAERTVHQGTDRRRCTCRS